MDPNTKKQGSSIIFLTKDGFDLYNGITNNVLQFQFPTSIVKDLEILNIEEFQNQIKAFIEQNALQPSSFLIIYSAPVLFEKDILTKDLTAEQVDQTTKDFLSTVPFESVISKTIPFDGGIRISAGNKSFYESIKIPFEKARSSITAVVPYEALGSELAEITALDYSNAQAIFGKINSIKSNAFSMEEAPEKKTEKKVSTPLPTTNATKSPGTSENKEILEKEPINKKRIFLMGGIFVLLLLVLGYLVLNPPA